MDIIDLLILAAFVGFPLLQMVLEKLGGGRKPPPPPTEYEPYDLELPPLPQPARTGDAAEASTEESWSAGWGEWPTEPDEDSVADDVVIEEVGAEDVMSRTMAEELIALQERLARRRDTSEVTRVRVPVVSLEDPQVDRKAEHARLHARPPGQILAATRPQMHPLQRSMGSRSELRRAVVLAEVLGKPLSLR